MAGGRPRWSPETLVCALRGHALPAGDVARLGPADAGLGIELGAGQRLVRCVRCDAWIALAAPPAPAAQTLPTLDQLELPRRGRALRDVIVLRAIAVERGLHCLVFLLLAVLLILLDVRFRLVEQHVQALDHSLDAAITSTGANPNRDLIAHELDRLLRLRPGTLRLLIATDLAYLLIESVEAVGLWLLQRWAEYLTVVATAGLLPFELYALTQQVTVLRVVALGLNLVILVYLVWAKRLFGLRRGAVEPAEPDRAALFGPPQASSPRREASQPSAGA